MRSKKEDRYQQLLDAFNHARWFKEEHEYDALHIEAQARDDPTIQVWFEVKLIDASHHQQIDGILSQIDEVVKGFFG